MSGLRQALLFLTRIPVGQVTLTAKGWGDALNYFPVVGLIIGILLWLSASLLHFAQPTLLAALILALWVYVTGALHLDGLADTTDAWVGGIESRERTLAIMKDPNCGAMGVVSLIITLLIKYTAIVTILQADVAMLLVVIPTWTRGMLIWVFVTTAYARASGIPREICKHLSINRLMWILPVSIVLPALLLHWWVALLLISMLALVCLVWRRAVIKRISGFTGDTLGALIEISETALLLMAALTL